MKKAQLISQATVAPKFEHDCEACTFLGRLDGQDLYVCAKHGLEYLARFGGEGHQYGSLGDLTPQGTPYAFARALHARRNAVSASLQRFKRPMAWRTA
jgi:hypothetical protein